METAKPTIDQILKHPTVSRAMLPAGHPKRPAEFGLQELCHLRRRIAQYKAARRNWREEAPAAELFERRHGAGSAYEAGYVVAPPAKVVNEVHGYIERALRQGLPTDVAELCHRFLAQEM